MSYVEITKLENEILCAVEDLNHISDPEDFDKHIQRLIKKLSTLQKKNPSEHEKYESLRKWVECAGRERLK